MFETWKLFLGLNRINYRQPRLARIVYFINMKINFHEYMLLCIQATNQQKGCWLKLDLNLHLLIALSYRLGTVCSYNAYLKTTYFCNNLTLIHESCFDFVPVGGISFLHNIVYFSTFSSKAQESMNASRDFKQCHSIQQVWCSEWLSGDNRENAGVIPAGIQSLSFNWNQYQNTKVQTAISLIIRSPGHVEHSKH